MSRVDIHVGIDVAKDRLDVAQRPGAEAWWVTNDERGIADLVARLRALRPTLMILEATGGIELHVVGALAAARLAVVVVNPRQTREFAKATGRLTKTRRYRCPGLGPVCRGRAASASPSARRCHPATEQRRDAPPSGDRDAHRGEEPSPHCSPSGT